MGSVSEVKNHLLLTRDLNLRKESDHEQLESQVIEVKRMLAPFIKRLRADRR
jgi:four helix bundle protein